MKSHGDVGLGSPTFDTPAVWPETSLTLSHRGEQSGIRNQYECKTKKALQKREGESV